MSFPAYPTYTDSGVEWLGEVPTHWSVHRVSELYREVAEPGHDELPILSVSIHDGVSDDEAEPNDEGRKINRSDDRSKYKQVRPNDLVYNMMRAWQGGFGSVKVLGMVSPAYVVARPRDNVPSDLVELVLRTAGAIEEMRRRSKGVTDFRLRLYWDEFKDMRIALPPAREQLDILNFLARETAKIEALVEEQRRLIALLIEKRQAVISHAVTKGLSPDAPMKDSGVEWLGEVPSHWDIRRIKTILKGIKQGWSPQCDAEPVDSFDAWGVLKAGCVNEGYFNPSENKALPSELEPLPELAVRAGDVLVSRANTRDLVGSAALVESDYQRLLLSDKLYCLDVDRNQIDPGFLALYLQADAARGQIEVAATGASSSMLNIGQAVIREMPIAIPSLEEQWKIVANIKQRRVAFISLISEASNAISILNERRAALISAAVTGKIDVCGSAKVLPFPVDRARARRLIAAEIIDRSAHQATFGRTKLQKLLFLAEAHANVNELAGRYVRMPYGPLDQDMIDEIEGAAADTDFAVDDPGNRKMVRYRPIATRGRNRSELAEWLGDDRVAKLDKLIMDFADLDTHGAEAVATLYAVWNDALIDGETASDDWIVNGFLTAWNMTKAENFDRHELLHRLGWMRRHGLVPTGAGPKTSIGGLFA